MRNIRLGAKIEGLLRRESYELPVEAIREMIINAHCHRNLTEESCVQVAIYDDRLEVTSPGGLYNGLTYEQLMNGHSRIRNRAIANVFNQMGIVEAWGSGIKRIRDAAADAGLSEPEFLAYDDMFCVNLYRMPMDEESDIQFDRKTDSDSEEMMNSEETSRKTGSKNEENSEEMPNSEENREENSRKTSTNRKTNRKTDRKKEFISSEETSEDKILAVIRDNSKITLTELSDEMGLSYGGTRYIIGKLQQKGILQRVGGRKMGQWLIVKESTDGEV